MTPDPLGDVAAVAKVDEVAAVDAHPYLTELAAEHRAWDEIVVLVHRLRPEELLRPGYFEAPDWSVRDLAAHLGTWLAEAENQLERMIAATYDPSASEVDVNDLNARLLDGMRDQPWAIVWTQANAARTKMLEDWAALPAASDAASWWIRKSGADHYAEHVPRLRAWVADLVAARRRG